MEKVVGEVLGEKEKEQMAWVELERRRVVLHL